MEGSKAPTFEYRIVQALDAMKLSKAINELGSECWQIVGMLPELAMASGVRSVPAIVMARISGYRGVDSGPQLSRPEIAILPGPPGSGRRG